MRLAFGVFLMWLSLSFGWWVFDVLNNPTEESKPLLLFAVLKSSITLAVVQVFVFGARIVWAHQ